MPYIVRDLPTIATTASGTNSNAIGRLDDAANIALWVTTATTTPLQIQVEFSDTGAAFIPLLFNTSGASIQTVTSSGVVHITNIAFRQLRMSSTGTTAAAVSANVTKQISV